MLTLTTYQGVKGYAVYFDGQLTAKMTSNTVQGMLPPRTGLNDVMVVVLDAETRKSEKVVHARVSIRK